MSTNIILLQKSKVNVINSSGNKYVLNNLSSYSSDVSYNITKGKYIFSEIPEQHPIAILNSGKINKIKYRGDIKKKLSKTVTGTTADGTYDFYYGNVTVTVLDDFGTVSLYCYNHGYMGGENALTYNNDITYYDIRHTFFGIYYNKYAYSILNPDGTVDSFGNDSRGGNNSSVKNKLRNVSKIINNEQSFAAILKNGTVFAWGTSLFGGNTSNYSSNLVNVIDIVSSKYAYAALKSDGTVFTWGHENYGGNSNNVQNNLNGIIEISSTNRAFAALKYDGTVIVWGDTTRGGDASSVQSNLTNVKHIVGNSASFSALKNDGTVVTWGDTSRGGDSSDVSNNLVNVEKIYPSYEAYAALKTDKTVIAWGGAGFGGNSTSVDASLNNIKEVLPYHHGFVAITNNDSLLAWGNASFGGNPSSVQSSLVDISAVALTHSAIAALKKDGSVVAWGHSSWGGNASSVQSQLTNVVNIYANEYAFTAQKSDGTLVSWGNSNYGANNSAISSNLTNIIKVFGKNTSFIAIKNNGDIYGWGSELTDGKMNYTLKNTELITTRYKTNRVAPLYTDKTLFSNNSNINENDRILLELNIPFSNINILSASMTNNVLQTTTINKIKELTNITNKSTKSNLQKGIVNFLLNKNNLSSLSINVADLNLSDKISKKKIIYNKANNNTFDLTTKNNSVSNSFIFEDGYSIILKTKNGNIIVKREDYNSNELYYIQENDVSLNTITLKKHKYCNFYNFTTNTGYFVKGDQLKIDDSLYEISSLLDITPPVNTEKIIDIFSNDGAFCALRNTGFITCWGKTTHGGTAPTDISNVKTIFSSADTFSALLKNNTIITWGNTQSGNPETTSDIKLTKKALLDRKFSLQNNMNTVPNNNYKLQYNFIFNSGEKNRPIKQIVNKKTAEFINEFGNNKYNIIENIDISSNPDSLDNELYNYNILSNYSRHNVLDAFFINNKETTVNVSTSNIGLQNKLSKSKVIVYENNSEIDITDDKITQTTGAYSNLSDLSDNITIKMKNNVTFKVTRTTSKASIGRYIISEISSSISVKYNNITTVYSTGETAGLYADDDIIYINDVKYFFGGFGTDGETINNKEDYSPIVYNDESFSYLNKDGTVISAGSETYGGMPFLSSSYSILNCSGPKKLDNVVQIVSNFYGYSALKNDGTVVSWGKEDYNSLKGYTKGNHIITTSLLEENKNVIKLFSNHVYNVALTKDRKVFAWGYIHTKNNIPQMILKNNLDSTSSIHETNNLSNPIITPLENIHKVIMNEYATALITFDKKLITFGFSGCGGDYTNSKYGIYGLQNSITGKTVQTTVLENVKKVISINNTSNNCGFVALTYDNKCYVWGFPELNNLSDIGENVLDIEEIHGGFIAKYSDQIKVFSKETSRNITSISTDISNNIIKIVSNSKAIAFLRNDGQLFLTGTNDYGASLADTYYKYTNRDDILANNNMKNVSKVFASERGFGVIKTNGEALVWGENDSYNQNYILNTYGGSVTSNVKNLYTNGKAWCALKNDETIVTFDNGQAINAALGTNFLDTTYGINSIKHGGSGSGGALPYNQKQYNVLQNVKNVIPIYVSTSTKRGGFIAITSLNDISENAYIWGWESLPDISFNTLTSLNGHIDKPLGLHNTFPLNHVGFYTISNYNSIYDNKEKLYKKLINVTVENIDGNNKFVLNNDKTKNPIQDDDLNYEFNLSDSTLSTHPFKIKNSPYTTNTEWNSVMNTIGEKAASLDIMTNKYNIIYCETHGTGMGSLYNDPNILTDISEGTIVETQFTSQIKTSIGSIHKINNDKSISDASLNIVAYTTYSDRSKIFNLIHNITNKKNIYFSTTQKTVDITSSDISQNDMFIYGKKILIFDENTYMNIFKLNKLSNSFIGNLLEKDSFITVDINKKRFKIVRTSENNNSVRYKIKEIRGVIQLQTLSTTYNITNNQQFLENSDIDNTKYFVENDSVIIDDIKFTFTDVGFYTNGTKILYKEIIISSDNNGNNLFNGSLFVPSLEYGVNYKFIMKQGNYVNSPLYLSKTTF